MVSFPIDQGQEAAGIEVQVIMVGVWVQTAVRCQRSREKRQDQMLEDQSEGYSNRQGAQ